MRIPKNQTTITKPALKTFLSLTHRLRTLPCAVILTGGIATMAQGSIWVAYDTGADGTTPGSHTFTSGGSWAGDGTVQPFSAALPPSGPNPLAPNSPIVTGFSNGVLQLTDLSLAGPSAPYTPTGFSTTHSISIANGTATLSGSFNTSNVNDNYIVTPTAGSTCISYTTFFSDPLHARHTGSAQYFPWLGSLQMPNSANATITIDGISTLTSTDGTLANATSTQGIAGGLGSATITGLSLGAFIQPTSTSLQWFTETTGGESHINGLIPSDPGNLHPSDSGVPANTSTTVLDAMLNDGERVHAQSITWVLKPDSGTFDGTEQFIFSFDGARSEASALAPVIAIPEPASTTLLLLGALTMAGRRNRA